MADLASGGPRVAERTAAAVLGGVFLLEGFFVCRVTEVLVDPHRFLVRFGFAAGPHLSPLAGWFCAALVTALYVGYSATLPSVRATLIRPSWLKLLAIGMAVVAGILEEAYFRSIVMGWARDQGAKAVLQVALSAISFGVAHGIWALFGGNWRAGVGAAVATGTLGLSLAVVYLLSARSLAPCVSAHILLDVLIEPGLILAAMRGEMTRSRFAHKTSPQV